MCRHLIFASILSLAGFAPVATAQEDEQPATEAAPADEDVGGEALAEESAAEEAPVEESVAPPPEPMPAPGKASKFGVPDLIADGGRVTVRDGDFSLRPPVGWEVYTQLNGLTLLSQAPHKPGMRYQRTLQVASFSEPRFIDELTAREYEEVIVKKYSAIDSTIEDYRIRNHMNVDMADGRKALLFYTEFKQVGVPLMQAHILVSSATRHYLMTFTDVAEHFEDDETSEFLKEAWESMTSVELGTRTPQRFETFAAVGVGVVALIVVGFMFIAFRAWRSGKKYQAYADGRDVAEEDAVSGPPRSLGSMGPITGDAQTLASTDHDKRLDDDDSTTKEDIAI